MKACANPRLPSWPWPTSPIIMHGIDLSFEKNGACICNPNWAGRRIGFITRQPIHRGHKCPIAYCAAALSAGVGPFDIEYRFSFRTVLAFEVYMQVKSKRIFFVGWPPLWRPDVSHKTIVPALPVHTLI